MRRQVPSHINILLEKPQVQSAGADVANLSNITAFNNFLDLSHCRRVEKRVSRHQHQSIFPRNFN